MVYNGEHSLTFLNESSDLSMNTWLDWHLIPKTKLFFNPPSVKTHYVDIPGSNNMVDLTESITGYPMYSNREGSLEFIVANGYEDWTYLYSSIKDFLHGKELSAILDDDPNYKYTGRFSINEFSSEKDYSKIVINYSIYPFRFELNDSITPWKWDPFNFYDGVITYNQTYDFNTYADHFPISCPFLGKETCPIFRVSKSRNLKVTYKNDTYDLVDGDNYIPSIFLEGDKTRFMFTGIGEVKIIYTIRRF